MENVFRGCIAGFKHERGSENSRQLCLHNCGEFSQPLECLYQAIQIQKKVFYCFYNLTFARKNVKLSVMALIKIEFLTSRESCTQSLVRVISFCFLKKDFSRLYCQLKRKKIDTASFKKFSKFQPTREWVNK